MKTLTKTIVIIAIMQSLNLNAKKYTIIDFFDYGAFEINISLALNITNYNKICNEIGYDWYGKYVSKKIHTIYDSLYLYDISEEKLINGISDLIIYECKKLGFEVKKYDMVLAIDSKSEVEYFKKDERKESIMFGITTTTLISIIVMLISINGVN